MPEELTWAGRNGLPIPLRVTSIVKAKQENSQLMVPCTSNNSQPFSKQTNVEFEGKHLGSRGI